MQITIFGTGYVGLVTGACLAEEGNNVLCVDINAGKIAALQRGEIPIYEPGLEDLVERNTAGGRLRFTTSTEAGVRHGEVLFIAVGTPPDEDGSADVSHVLSVASSIGEHMRDYCLVVTKSTVPVGTTEKVRGAIREQLRERRLMLDFDVASNPEFLKEGAAISDFMKPDRVVIGVDGKRAARTLRQLYAGFNRSSDRIVEMDIRSSEMTKYAANAMLATKISFMNEMANLADRVGADVDAIRRGIGADRRIGYHFIYPGCGFGGSCFPKDVQALARTGDSVNYDTPLIDSVLKVNERQKEVLFRKILQHFQGNLAGKTFALWGLAFKPNTDDMREASSRVLMDALWNAGARVQAYDPEAMGECQRIYGDRSDLLLCETPEEALKNADALLVITEWHLFRNPSFTIMERLLNEPVIFDGRNLYDPQDMADRGFTYYGIGRGQRSVSIPAALPLPATGTHGGLVVVD